MKWNAELLALALLAWALMAATGILAGTALAVGVVDFRRFHSS